ncbi:MAG: ATP-binding protein [Actinobacteria bacterium]|nr:ATP-binding protein [Actinomycetota bacterium]MCA1721791.1 ATP-binding protein [Actinomycetota bacterium]
MCRHVTFEVPPEPRSVPSAREFCRDTLAGWQLAHMVDDAQVILSELVTNGVLHAGPPIGVTISSETGNVELAVSDGSSAVPVVRPRRADLSGDLDELISGPSVTGVSDDRDPRLDVGPAGTVVGGRGLQLVVSLAAEWGVAATRTGKSVWARLVVPAGWPPTDSCTCPGGSTRLASGRTVTVR